MELRPKVLPTMCCFVFLSACASNQSVGVSTLAITPIVTKSSSDNPESMYLMGRYYQGQNRYELAIAAYQKALDADSSFFEALNGQGVIYSRQAKNQDAIDAFKSAIRLAPQAAHLYSNLGYAYYLNEQYYESVLALEQATVIDPSSKRALNNLGLAYAKVGNKEESVLAFTQAANLDKVVVSDSTAAAPMSALSVSGNGSYVVQADASKAEVQILTLPKDKGVIRPDSESTVRMGKVIPVMDSRMKLLQVAPNVYELRDQLHSHELLPVIKINIREKVKVEVSNGNGVTGMAGTIGRFLRSQGYPEIRLTNQKPYIVGKTQIQYREGFQSDAQDLQASLPLMPELVQRNNLRTDVALRLVLGKDIATRTAYFN